MGTVLWLNDSEIVSQHQGSKVAQDEEWDWIAIGIKRYGNMHPSHAMDNAKMPFYHLRQTRNMSLHDYGEKYQATVDSIRHKGGKLGLFSGTIWNLICRQQACNQWNWLKLIVEEEYLATTLIFWIDPHRFAPLIKQLKYGILVSCDKYSCKITDSFNLLLEYEKDHKVQVHGPSNDGVTFATVTTEDEGVAPASGHRHRKAFDKSNITCGVTMQIGSDGKLPSSWILLDNQTTVDVFSNPQLLSKIWCSDTTMDIHCTAGVASTNMIGDLGNYCTVWYHPACIANILSLAQVCAHSHHVSYDSTNGNTFKVEKGDSVQLFQQSPKGLYFFDTKISKDACVFVSTVENNHSNYTTRDYSRALLARKLQQNIGRPSTKIFLQIISNNLLPNCPVTTQDVLNAECILGPDVGSLKGETVRRWPIPVADHLVSIPAELMQMYCEVTLSGDIMFVNWIAFFVTKSRKN
jgi:hypothetical protein